jgi:hypothetical protein
LAANRTPIRTQNRTCRRPLNDSFTKKIFPTNVAGLTADLKFDKRYTMDTSRHLNDHYTFDGYTNTRIVFFMSKGVAVWNMTILDDKTVYATTDTTGKEETFTKFPHIRIFLK